MKTPIMICTPRECGFDGFPDRASVVGDSDGVLEGTIVELSKLCVGAALRVGVAERLGAGLEECVCVGVGVGVGEGVRDFAGVGLGLAATTLTVPVIWLG